MRLRRDSSCAPFIGQQLKDLPLADGVLIALIRRDGKIMVPRGRFELRENDRLTILGEPADISRLQKEYPD